MNQEIRKKGYNINFFDDVNKSMEELNDTQKSSIEFYKKSHNIYNSNKSLDVKSELISEDYKLKKHKVLVNKNQNWPILINMYRDNKKVFSNFNSKNSKNVYINGGNGNIVNIINNRNLLKLNYNFSNNNNMYINNNNIRNYNLLFYPEYAKPINKNYKNPFMGHNINQNLYNNIENNYNQHFSNFNNLINMQNYQNNNISPNNRNDIYNQINNINIIQNNLIINKNYRMSNKNNSFINEPNAMNHINNINNSQNQYNNLDYFMQYINSLPMPLDNFLCTPKGTLEVQKKLEKSTSEYRVLIVNILQNKGLVKIMKNTYGNYFFQQLIKKNEKSFISLIISYISEDLIDISKDFSGTFCLQALLDEITSFEEEQTILNCIKNSEMEMAFNKNATHVLRKIVQLFPDIHRTYLNEIILKNFVELFLDSNGICLIKIFIKTNTLISNKKQINDKIVNNFVTLAESPFGNYGIQYLMELWDENDLKDVKEKIFENIYKLSLQQFASNVIEKAIEIFDEKNRKKMIKKLCFKDNFVINLLNNKFGKFVLNKAIKFMQTEMINEFEINLNNDINNNIFKSKDKNKIKKLLMKIKTNKIKKGVYFSDVNNKFFNNNDMHFNNETNNVNKYNIMLNNDVNH